MMDPLLSDEQIRGYIGKTIVFGGGCFLVWTYSRLLDKRAGINFKEAWHEMRKDPRAVARYLGSRWLGLCILGAAAVFFS